MENSNLLVGLDIGTTSVKVVVADADPRGMQIIGAVASPTKGMRHGKIVDIAQTADSVKQALDEAAKKTNTAIHRVVTALPVNLLQLESGAGMINVSDQGSEVNDHDVASVLSAAVNSAKKSNREAISFLPSRFLIDGKTDVDDPRKMIAHSLAVQGVLVTAPTGELHNFNKVIEKAGYKNNFFVPAPLAIASVALDEGEKTFGTILLDCGGGSTAATVIHENQIKYATVDLEGASDITNDISIVLSTSKTEAEELKRDYGFAEPELASEKETFSVKAVGQDSEQTVNEKYLSEIINARLEQILKRVGRGLYKHGALSLPGGFVITGGSALLQGIDDLVSQGFDVKAKIYQPTQIGLRNPIYSVAYGVTNYAYNLADIDFLVNNVIYGTKIIPDHVEDKKATGSVKNIKRTSRITESNSNLAYNNNKSDESSSEKKQTKDKKEERNKNRDRGLSALFKKFFD